MTITETICTAAKNSTCQATSGHESVEQIMHELSLSSLNRMLSSFFEYSRSCALALMEMLMAAQELSKQNDDGLDNLVYLTRAVSVLVELEKTRPEYEEFRRFLAYSRERKDNPVACADEDSPAVKNLIRRLSCIVNAIDTYADHDPENSFQEFSHDVAFAVEHVKTREAYQDMVHASATVQTIYVAYLKQISCKRRKNMKELVFNRC